MDWKSKAAGLTQRAAHAGKHYKREWAKFHFDVRVKDVKDLPELNGATAVLVAWARGPKVASSTEVEPTAGAAEFNQTIPLVCTMYNSKKPNKRWSDKVYRVSVYASSPGEFGTHKRKLAEVAHAEVDLSQYASVSQDVHETTVLRLGYKGKPLIYAYLTVEISSRWLKDLGQGASSVSASDAQSISSFQTGSQAAHHGPNDEQNLEGFEVGNARAAAEAKAKISKLAVIREGLTSKLDMRRNKRAAGGSQHHSDRSTSDVEVSRPSPAGARQPPAVGPGPVPRAEEWGASSPTATSSLPPPPPSAAATEEDAESVASANTQAAIGDTGAARAQEDHPPTSAASRAREATPEATPPPPRAEGTSTRRDAGDSSAGSMAQEDVAAELERLKNELLAASSERDRALVEAADTRRQIDALRDALDEQALLHEEQARAAEAAVPDDDEAAGSPGPAEVAETHEELTALRQERDGLAGEVASLRRELEQARHSEGQLKLALASARDDSDDGEDDMERTELQLALVEAKMQLATMEYEREEVRSNPTRGRSLVFPSQPSASPRDQAMHKARMLTQELEKSSASHLRVSKEMTWLEVKYSDARSELVQVKHHQQSLEQDIKEMINLKLELAEARSRIEELEGMQ